MAINLNPAHKGRLHSTLKVPQGQPIPAGKLTKALDAKSPAVRKEAQFAENAKGWDHSGQPAKPAPGRAGGIIGAKSAPGPMGHAKQTTTPVSSDRGDFKIRG